MIDRYNDTEISKIWSSKRRYELWRDIEAVLFQAKDEDVPEINIDNAAMYEIDVIESSLRHDVVAFIRWYEKKLMEAGFKNSRFVHFGLTSSDVVDTAFTIQIKETNKILIERCERLFDALWRLPTRFNDIDVIGRTHGQSAELLKLSDKVAVWFKPLNWHVGMIKNTQYVGKMSGSLGDNKYIGKENEEMMLAMLGLSSGPTQGQIVSRAYYARIINDWAILAALLEKVALDIRLHSQSEILEIVEVKASEQIGSSSMPHKVNPVGSENICGLSRLVRGYASVAMENIALWDERDISHSSNERVIFPDAAILIGYMLNRLTDIVDSLFVNESMIKEHTTEKLLSQKNMLANVEAGLSRADAHKEAGKNNCSICEGSKLVCSRWDIDHSKFTPKCQHSGCQITCPFCG